MMRAARRRAATNEELAPILCFDGLEIDLIKKLVKINGKPVHLTPTEYGLLTCMATNPGRLLTHAWLLQKVWGPGYGTESNYLRLFVRQLRISSATPRPRPQSSVPFLGGSDNSPSSHRLR